MSDYGWAPSPDYVENANVTRLARAYGMSGLPELRARSVTGVRWYWDAVVRDLGLPFRQAYTEVLDTSPASSTLAGSSTGGSTWSMPTSKVA